MRVIKAACRGKILHKNSYTLNSPPGLGLGLESLGLGIGIPGLDYMYVKVIFWNVWFQCILPFS